MSRPVCAVAPGLSTHQGDAFFPELSQHIYQSDMQNVDYSSDSQQHAITQRSHSTRRASPVAEHGNPGATAMSTNVQSSTVAMAFFNHGMVTPGQSPSFIDGQIVSDHIPPAPWDTGFALDSADISATVYSQPQHVIFAVEGGQQLLQPAPAPPPSLQLQSFLQSQPTPQLRLAPRPLQTQPARGLSPKPEPNHQVQRRREPRDITIPFMTVSAHLAANNFRHFLGRPMVESMVMSNSPGPAKKTNGHQQLWKWQVLIISAIYPQPLLLHRHRAKDLSDRCSVDVLHHRPPPALSWQETTHPIEQHQPCRRPKSAHIFNFRQQAYDHIVRMIPPRSRNSRHNSDIMWRWTTWAESCSVFTSTTGVPGEGQVNERFAIAKARFRELLQAGNLDESESVELVTLASLLSMQDVVLTECRLRKPHCPRWLMGFSEAEKVLQRTDPGSRFYEESYVQVSALRLSQSVIVAKAVVLAQLMMPLPPLATFNPVAEESRFGYLLSGTEEGMCEIHGGCGFSRRLLHIFSQVTYCATLMLQDGETPIIPETADMLRYQLLDLKQWSGEIPRNHQMVIENLADLAKCISIMPTSGFLFTAQAPLLPVFFLGLLATVEEHVRVANAWFQEVIETPVRSSVPPLYESLKRIQSWMGKKIPVPTPNTKLPCAIAERQAWWERMVHQVQERGREVLCLT
ncbi:hypothetical protein ISF_09873 [Cordyceps fumosorosea ARSEF 2679]|uniref:Uncharacterized protein n=1 Tax=Cordyceps fumosorosea (strain ARSEF 2679) TaxID=1081104 RepID=A0A167AH27_CORFA|nr:hypothetical protein ISF_09873 [Cordyceps fumosorosea ARSEF 2679]OAA38909.1 hypothetical protein ISF_09873 [Cordyceps fumosorosea ARSEF 2679]